MIKLLISINHQLEELLDLIQQHTQVLLDLLEIGLLVCLNQNPEVINQEDFHSMLKVVDVKPVKVMVLLLTKCIFYQMFIFNVMNVKEQDIIVKL